MRLTLAGLLKMAVGEAAGFWDTELDKGAYVQWLDRYPTQLVVLSAQVAWSEHVEDALKRGGLGAAEATVEGMLGLLADTVLTPQPPVRRRKLEHLITELVHQRDVTRSLLANNITDPSSFDWLSQMRFSFDLKHQNPLLQLSIRMADASFSYG